MSHQTLVQQAPPPDDAGWLLDILGSCTPLGPLLHAIEAIDKLDEFGFLGNHPPASNLVPISVDPVEQMQPQSWRAPC